MTGCASGGKPKRILQLALVITFINPGERLVRQDSHRVVNGLEP